MQHKGISTNLAEDISNQEIIMETTCAETVLFESSETVGVEEMPAEPESEKLKKANIIIAKLQKSQRTLIKHVRKLTYENAKLTAEVNNQKQIKNLTKILNTDQMEVLRKKSGRVGKWSNDTVKKALRFKLSAGVSGYQELLNQGIPLPSQRTLRRRCEHLDFKPGIYDQIFHILQDKVLKFSDDREKDCVLAIDEMSIMEGEQIDHSTMSTFGLSTLPDKNGKLLKNI